MAVRFSLIVVCILTLAAYFYDPIMAQGVLLGGIGGILGFWIIAVRLEKVAQMNPGKVKYAALTWSGMRYALYGAVLYKAFTLDRETYHGLVGALIGIMVIRFMLVFIGAFGLDLKVESEESTDTVAEASEEDDVPE
jgi:hypothetical protein